MKKLIEFVDQVYCIHDTSSDDRKEIYKDLEELNPKYIFAARPPRNFSINNHRYSGTFGATLSHLKVLIDALACNHSRAILIFEDDVYMRPGVDYDSIMENAINNLPKDWVSLYIGCIPHDKVVKRGENLYSSNNLLGGYAIILNAKVLPELLNFYIDRLCVDSPNGVVDGIYRDFCSYVNIPQYAVYPFITVLRPGVSLARKAHRDYGERFCENKWKEYLV